VTRSFPSPRGGSELGCAIDSSSFVRSASALDILEPARGGLWNAFTAHLKPVAGQNEGRI
jgi:hypothetical protein